MKPPKGEGNHGSGPVRVGMWVRFVPVTGAVKVFERVELLGSIVETAKFHQSEGVVCEVGQVVVGQSEERQRAGA